MADLKPGDEVRVFTNGPYAPSDPGEVVKIGRKLVTVRVYGRDEQFRLDDQCWTGRQTGYGMFFRTLEQVAAEQRAERARGVLEAAGLEVKLGHRPSGALLEAVAATIEAFERD